MNRYIKCSIIWPVIFSGCSRHGIPEAGENYPIEEDCSTDRIADKENIIYLHIRLIKMLKKFHPCLKPCS